MSACPACGRPARPIVAYLLAAPVGAGLASFALLGAAAGKSWAPQAKVAVGAIFVILAAGLLWFGLRILNGVACPGCGRRKTA